MSNWVVLMESLFHADGSGKSTAVNGPTVREWLDWIDHDWDAVDAIYTEAETIGG